MSEQNGPDDEMARDLAPAGDPDLRALDDGTLERLLSGVIAADDAPPPYREVVGLLEALRAEPTAAELADEHEQVASIARTILEAGSADRREPRLAFSRRVRLAGAALVGALTLVVGLGVAGALPGAMQRVASDVLGTVGVAVPSPDHHADAPADGHGPTRDTSASDRSGPAAVPTSSTAGKGATIAPEATDPSTVGVDKGAGVSSDASNGKSQAGDHGQGQPASDPPPSSEPGNSGNGPPATTPATAPGNGNGNGTGNGNGNGPAPGSPSATRPAHPSTPSTPSGT